jgi:hypothetical protein
MLDPITKHILSEGELEKVDKELGNKEKDIKDIPKDSDHTKDPKTGKCSKNPHDEEVDDKSSTMKGGAGKANY